MGKGKEAWPDPPYEQAYSVGAVDGAGMMPKLKPASYNCQQCGKIVTRADKPGIIYYAFVKLKYCGYECSALGSRKDHVAVFWQNVRKTETCWIWMGGKSDKGYGVLHKDGKKIYAHRYSYELHNGKLGGFHALHSCDNPICVNPSHLRAGTHQENMMDAKTRRRFDARKQNPHPSAKLTKEQVNLIRKSEEKGVNLANLFGVSKSTIYAARTGQNWRDL